MSAPAPEADLCAVAPQSTDQIGAGCPRCGHTNLVHPGWHNPSVRHCAICEILAVKNSVGGP